MMIKLITFLKPDFVLYTILDELYEENNKKCKLTFMKEAVPFYNIVVLNLDKNGPFTKAINEQYKLFKLEFFTFNLF